MARGRSGQRQQLAAEMARLAQTQQRSSPPPELIQPRVERIDNMSYRELQRRAAPGDDRAELIGRPSGDVVLTVPQKLWSQWVAEGDLAGHAPGGLYDEYHYTIGRKPPQLEIGCRVYIVAFGRLRGYAPLLRVDRWDDKRWSLVRQGGAEAVTIDEEIAGFRGLRYRWWPRSLERPYPAWLSDGIPGA